MPGLSVGSVDLDDSEALAGQVSGDAGAVGAGALDADQVDVTERGEPRDNAAVAAGGGIERFDS